MPEVILQTPWSSVYRFDTDQGSLYLKQVPPGLSKESQVIHLLQETCGAPVPLVIADNPLTHCFLMQDAGITLREYFKQGFNADLLLTAIRDYIAVQRKSIPHLGGLLNLDASDEYNTVVVYVFHRHSSKTINRQPRNRRLYPI